MRRLMLALSTKVEHNGVSISVFSSVEKFLGADDAVLRAAGLSAGKRATLRHAVEAIATGAMSETMLEERSSADAGLLLRGIEGIGQCTAAVILLRGLGRLNVFPGCLYAMKTIEDSKPARAWHQLVGILQYLEGDHRQPFALKDAQEIAEQKLHIATASELLKSLAQCWPLGHHDEARSSLLPSRSRSAPA